MGADQFAVATVQPTHRLEPEGELPLELRVATPWHGRSLSAAADGRVCPTDPTGASSLRYAADWAVPFATAVAVIGVLWPDLIDE